MHNVPVLPLRINVMLTRQAAKLLVCYSQVYVYFTQVGDVHSKIYLSHSFGPLHCHYSCLHSGYLEWNEWFVNLLVQHPSLGYCIQVGGLRPCMKCIWPWFMHNGNPYKYVCICVCVLCSSGSCTPRPTLHTHWGLCIAIIRASILGTWNKMRIWTMASS